MLYQFSPFQNTNKDLFCYIWTQSQLSQIKIIEKHEVLSACFSSYKLSVLLILDNLVASLIRRELWLFSFIKELFLSAILTNTTQPTNHWITTILLHSLLAWNKFSSVAECRMSIFWISNLNTLFSFFPINSLSTIVIICFTSKENFKEAN